MPIIKSLEMVWVAELFSYYLGFSFRTCFNKVYWNGITSRFLFSLSYCIYFHTVVSIFGIYLLGTFVIPVDVLHHLFSLLWRKLMLVYFYHTVLWFWFAFYIVIPSSFFSCRKSVQSVPAYWSRSINKQIINSEIINSGKL